jgi:uncharacterized protein YigA (DUF484 family)
MARLLSFEDHALAQLRRRLGAAEEARDDLLAFARGHSGAVAAIHDAVVAILRAPDLDSMMAIVRLEWPRLLGVDAIALALDVDGRGFRFDADGTHFVDPRWIAAARPDGVQLSIETQGHPLFGRAFSQIRTQALIAIDPPAPAPHGVLLIGQHSARGIEPDHGADLLGFVGEALAAMLDRWTRPTPPTR